jgi:hypothetical protein
MAMVASRPGLEFGVAYLTKVGHLAIGVQSRHPHSL